MSMVSNQLTRAKKIMSTISTSEIKSRKKCQIHSDVLKNVYREAIWKCQWLAQVCLGLEPLKDKGERIKIKIPSVDLSIATIETKPEIAGIQQKTKNNCFVIDFWDP